MEQQIFYSYCFNTETPKSKYQLVIRKDKFTNGETVYPDNSTLFDRLFALLMKGGQNTAVGDPLFSQSRCLEYHFFEFSGAKEDFLKYTKRMYLSKKQMIKQTALRDDIDLEIITWFAEKERKSSIYEHTIRIFKSADKSEAEQMEIPEGTRFSFIPESTSFEESFERMKKLSGQQYCEYLQKNFQRKYAQVDKEILEDELNPILEFIKKAEKKSRKDAFEKEDDDTQHEYLRIKHGYYLNHNCKWNLTDLSSKVYGEYFLFKTWLEEQLTSRLPNEEKIPSLAGWFFGKTDWSEIAWQYNTGKKYTHKQDLVAIFYNAYIQIQEKFIAYYGRYKHIDHQYLDDLVFEFRKNFPPKDRIPGIAYFDDLIELLVDKYSKPINIKNSNANFVTAISDLKSFKNSDLQNLDVEALIAEGEGKYIEFKSTFWVDMKTGEKSKAVEHSALKTIAAFLNSHGGVLIIGIEDNKNVIGLEKDFKLLSKTDKQDQFKTKFDDLIANTLGQGFHRHIDLDFFKVADKDVCLIRIDSRADHPAYINISNNDSSFYIRRQASTAQLSLKDCVDYINGHWKK